MIIFQFLLKRDVDSTVHTGVVTSLSTSVYKGSIFSEGKRIWIHRLGDQKYGHSIPLFQSGVGFLKNSVHASFCNRNKMEDFSPQCVINPFDFVIKNTVVENMSAPHR